MEILNLVKKDLIVYKVYIIIGAIASYIFGFFILVSSNILSMLTIFTVSVLFLCFNTYFGVMGDDKKNRTDMLVLSFPIDRKNVVISKYIVYILISLIFYTIYSFRVLYFIYAENWNTPSYPFAYFNIKLILSSYGIGVLIASVIHIFYYLVVYRQKHMYKLFTSIIYIVGVIGISLTSRLNYEYGSLEAILKNENLTLISTGIIGTGLVVYLLSMKASIYLYKKTEI